ncbi:PKD domain-containing protein [Salinibius halmophilus]|uniref:PKD domain-containing protein n=1 Tax=Salinibius halmophilus TaxID=1853216 RepID=UPI0013144806|nr:PKD domain-containing protein [Salinibius halmophilus]
MKKLLALAIATMPLAACQINISPIEQPQVEPTPDVQAKPAPMVVGQTVEADIALSLNGKVSEGATPESLSIERPEIIIAEPGASYLRVHFNELSIPQGMALEVRANDEIRNEHGEVVGQTVVQYDHTASLNEQGRFATTIFFADQLTLRLVGESSQAARVNVAAYDFGYPNPDSEDFAVINPLKTVGGPDYQHAYTYANAASGTRENQAYTHRTPVGKLYMNNSVCTAWKVGGGEYFMTNNHCIANQSEANGSEIVFNYERNATGPQVRLAVDQVIATNDPLDFTLFTVKNLNAAKPFGHFGLDANRPANGSELYIVHHPRGWQKHISLFDDQYNGACRVKDNNVYGSDYYRTTDISYSCDTEGGSSGSPVINAANNRVIALHHLGGSSANKGARIEEIWKEISGYFNGQLPTTNVSGGSSTPSNQAPTASFSSSAQALTVSFNNASRDADGTITTYNWQFGDGSTSSAASPSHTYVAGGTYTVSLTVTDDDGASDTTTKRVTVNEPVSSVTPIQNGSTVTGLSGTRSTNSGIYELVVPANASNLSIRIAGGTGDADLYVKQDSTPTTASWDCRPYVNGNSEVCEFASPQAGSYNIMLRGYTDFSGVSLSVSYDAGNTTPTPTPIVTPITSPIVTPGDCPSASAWSSSSIYTQGNHVSYNGVVYTAKWWTRGDTPGSTDPWYVWTKHSCN